VTNRCVDGVPTNVGGEFIYARSKTGQSTTSHLGDHAISSSGYIEGSNFPGGTDPHPPGISEWCQLRDLAGYGHQPVQPEWRARQ
jgi:hypothetical protein